MVTIHCLKLHSLYLSSLCNFALPCKDVDVIRGLFVKCMSYFDKDWIQNVPYKSLLMVISLWFLSFPFFGAVAFARNVSCWVQKLHHPSMLQINRLSSKRPYLSLLYEHNAFLHCG